MGRCSRITRVGPRCPRGILMREAKGDLPTEAKTAEGGVDAERVPTGQGLPAGRAEPDSPGSAEGLQPRGGFQTSGLQHDEGKELGCFPPPRVCGHLLQQSQDMSTGPIP